MRLLALILLITCVSFAAGDANITRSLNLTSIVSCPGNVLHMNVTASDGTPAENVELRLVLYLPYQGLRAIQHTDRDGLASMELTKNGSYRIYLYADDYNYQKYVEFEYPRMCPPPPPKKMNLSIEPDCENMRLSISAHADETGAPLEGVFILAGNWSSFTGNNGEVLVPFEKGFVFIRAERANYTSQEFYFDASCLPPPECLSDGDCDIFEFCSGGNCTNVTGECGYPANHTWKAYGCCADADCGANSTCANNTCVAIPAPPALPAANSTANLTENETQGAEPAAGAPPGPCIAAFLPGLLFLFIAGRRSRRSLV